MNELSVILSAVTQEAPCGENLYEDMGYEIQFARLVNAGLGIAAESFVDGQQTASAAPSGQLAWSELQDLLVDLFRQTKHLDMLYLLALTGGNLRGLAGLAETLDLTNSLLARQWDTLHPSESEGDYEFRQYCLGKMDSADFANSLDTLVIADSRQLGKHTLGALLAARKNTTGDLKTIEQALVETIKDKPDFYDELAAQLNELQESMKRLELTVKDHFASFRLQFKALKIKMAEIAQVISVFSNVTLEGIEGSGSPTGGAARQNPAGNSTSDQINSREDVVKILAKVILFYNKHEPTSPVPIMLERAQRVATMNFKEIVQEFNLNGTPPIQEVLGWKSEESKF